MRREQQIGLVAAVALLSFLMLGPAECAQACSAATAGGECITTCRTLLGWDAPPSWVWLAPVPLALAALALRRQFWGRLA